MTKIGRCTNNRRPDFSRQFMLDIDASDIGLGKVFSQVDNEEREVCHCLW